MGSLCGSDSISTRQWCPRMAERAATLGRRLVVVRKMRDAIQAELAALEKDHKEAEEAMWERLDDDKMTTGTYELGEPHGKVQFIKQERVKAVVRDPDRAVAAIKAEGLEKGLLDEAKGIRQKPLTDDLKHRLQTGKPFLDGVDVHFTRYVTVTLKNKPTKES